MRTGGSVLQGTVLEAVERRPLAHAELLVLSASGTQIAATGADESGRFTLHGVPVGELSVLVKLEGWCQLGLDGGASTSIGSTGAPSGRGQGEGGGDGSRVTIKRDGERVCLTVLMTRAPIVCGRVVAVSADGTEGQPVGGAIVTVRVAGPGYATSASVLQEFASSRGVADEAGWFSVPVPVRRGAIEIVARAEGLATFDREAADVTVLTRMENDVYLQPAGRLAGRVVDLEGSPVEAIRISILDQGSEGRSVLYPPGFWESFRTKTDADGRFIIDPVPAKTLVVMALRKDCVRSGLSDVAVSPDSTTEISLTVRRGMTIRGHVERANGERARGAVIVVEELEDSAWPLDWDDRLLESDDQGEFRIDCLRPGLYRLSIRDDGGAIAEPLVVRAGRTDVVFRIEDDRPLPPR